MVELDPDNGCKTYSATAELSSDEAWDDEDELEEWEEVDEEDEEDELWSEDDEAEEEF